MEKAVKDGAKYIKALLFNAHSIGKKALRSIVEAAHEKGLKVARVLPQKVTHLEKNIAETYRQHVSVTPSGIFDDPQLKFCMEVLGKDRITCSVDFPFSANQGAKAFIEAAPISF